MRIGFLGLGNMGAPMARCLIEAGFDVAVFDLSEAARQPFGPAARATGADAALGAEVVITMLPNGDVVRAALLGETGALEQPVPVVIDMSSSDALGTQTLGRDLAARGTVLVDAPVSGGVAAAQSGALTLMIGCDEAALVDRLAPVFDALSAKRFHVGGLGAGHAVKAINNVMAAANIAIASEGLLLAQRFGIAPENMFDVINASTGRSGVTETIFLSHVLTRRFGVGFAMGLMAKDAGLADALAKGQALDLPHVAATANAWRDAAQSLGPDTDFSAFLRFVEASNRETEGAT